MLRLRLELQALRQWLLLSQSTLFGNTDVPKSVSSWLVTV